MIVFSEISMPLVGAPVSELLVFLESVITVWWTYKLMKWKLHKHHWMEDSEIMYGKRSWRNMQLAGCSLFVCVNWKRRSWWLREIYVLFIAFLIPNMNYQIKESEVGRIHSMHRREEKCAQHFSQKIYKEPHGRIDEIGCTVMNHVVNMLFCWWTCLKLTGGPYR